MVGGGVFCLKTFKFSGVKIVLESFLENA
jgi:hypothetical protein